MSRPGEPIDTQISAQRGFDTTWECVLFSSVRLVFSYSSKNMDSSSFWITLWLCQPVPGTDLWVQHIKGWCVCCVCSGHTLLWGIFTKKAWLSTGQPWDKVVEILLHPHVLGKPWTCSIKSILDPRPRFSSLLSCHGSFAWPWHPSKAMPSADSMGSAGCCAAACGNMWAADVYFREAYPSDLHWQWWPSDPSYRPIRPIACISKCKQQSYTVGAYWAQKQLVTTQHSWLGHLTFPRVARMCQKGLRPRQVFYMTCHLYS